MRTFRAFFILLLITYNLQLTTKLYADTIYTNDGREFKGIVVEDYKDRITFSTMDGEVSLLKSDIKGLEFDTEEDNLLALADRAKDRKDYINSFGYYDMAFKLNPASKRAKDGMIFLQGYIFRRGEAQKEEVVKQREEFERGNEFAYVRESENEKRRKNSAALAKDVGLTLGLRGQLPLAEKVRPGSPAYEAGMREGDLVVAVWGRLTGYMPLYEVTARLVDKPSAEIKCAIERTLQVAISYDRSMISGPNDLIGATLKMEFEGLTVTAIKEGGQSYLAGAKKDDLITAIDGKSTRYMPINKAIEMIRESKNKSVALTIRRDIVVWKPGLPG